MSVHVFAATPVASRVGTPAPTPMPTPAAGGEGTVDAPVPVDEDLAVIGEEVRPSPLFRWGGKCYFLTYSQVSLTVFIVLSDYY